MDSESRGHAASLKDLLFTHPQRFEFFQAVRLLKRLRPEESVGGDDPDHEVVRFHSDVSMAFPASDVTALAPFGEEERAAVMQVAFMGAATPGSFGSLPVPYADEIRRRDAEKDHALHDFLDLFSDRLTALFYCAWEKHQLAVEHEVGAHRYFERALFSVIGMGTPGLHGRLALDDEALLSRAGLLAMAPAPASVIEQVLESYLEVPIRVRQFVPAWYEIDEPDRSRLGAANSRLGDDMVLGERTRLEQSKFEVCAGPLDWDRYQDFFPTATGFASLVDLVRLSITPEFDFDCRLVLRGEDVPPLCLEHTPSRACRLGWSTWLAAAGERRDADDAVLAGVPPSAARGGASDLEMEERP